MTRLYNALQLKRLMLLKNFGKSYCEPIAAFQEETTALPNNLQTLQNLCNSCHLCELSKTRNKVVFGGGDTETNIMFVGEAPGAAEDSTGRPFVGRAGELLTKMIENVLQRPRQSVYIANIVKCRPPNNRKPSSKEALTCRPFLLKQIEIIQPKLIVALGSTAFNYLSNNDTPISKVRGHFFEGNGYKILPTFHPSYLLRNPSAKKEAFEDMLKVKSFLTQD